MDNYYGPLELRAYLSDLLEGTGRTRGLFTSDFSNEELNVLVDQVIEDLAMRSPDTEGYTKGSIDYRNAYEGTPNQFIGLFTNDPITQVRNTVGSFDYTVTPEGDVIVNDKYDWSKDYQDIPWYKMLDVTSPLVAAGKFAHMFGGTREEDQNAMPYVLFPGNIYDQ